MSDSFNGAPFDVQWNTSEVLSHDATIVVRPIPGGQVSYVTRVHWGGPRPLNLSVTFLSEADYTAFVAQIGQRGTLVWGDESADAYLEKFSVSNPLIGGWRSGTASFLLL